MSEKSHKPDYTNRHKRQNFIRETCHQFVKTRLPDLYAKYRAEAETLFANERPDIRPEVRA